MQKLKNDERLFFGVGNSKLMGIHHFSLPAGYACPGALHCWAKANEKTGFVTDHPLQKFRCYAVSDESRYAAVRERRHLNYNLLRNKTRKEMRDIILRDFPKIVAVMRIHIGGDFFNQAYFDAWLDVAEAKPLVRFYAYTKSLPFWVNRILDIPPNLNLTASRGGRYDALIDKHSLRSATVVFHPEEAEALNLELSHHDNDEAAREGDGDFALLLHGSGRPGSAHGEATARMREEGIVYSYSGDG